MESEAEVKLEFAPSLASKAATEEQKKEVVQVETITILGSGRYE